MTRAFCALVGGNFGQALHYNALSFPLMFLTLVAPIFCLYELRSRSRIQWLHNQLFSSRIALRLAGIVVGYHLLRLGIWWQNGTLYREYFLTSWTWGSFLGGR